MTRVAVTTDRFDDVASAYLDAGLHPISLPCIQVRPAPTEQIEQARDQSSQADLLVITSPRAVSMVWPDGGMPDVETVVVGPSTAAAVCDAGGGVSLIGDAGLARLVELAEDRLGDRRVVFVHAAGSEPGAMKRLRDIAPGLEEHVVYRTEPTAPPLVPVDAVAFASPSAVAGWALSRDLDDIVVGAIGATTARAVARQREPDVVAEEPSHAALAEAIATSMEVKV